MICIYFLKNYNICNKNKHSKTDRLNNFHITGLKAVSAFLFSPLCVKGGEEILKDFRRNCNLYG